MRIKLRRIIQDGLDVHMRPTRETVKGDNMEVDEATKRIQ